MNTLADHIDECRNLAFAIAPELRDHPLYLLDAAELQTVRPEPDHCWAYACIAPDLGIRDYLKSQNRWQGHGRSIVFFCDAIREYTDRFRAMLLNTLVHELGHSVAAWIPDCDFDPGSVLLEMHQRRHLEFVADKNERHPIAEDHGGPFIRRTLHLWQRALWQGVYLEPWQLCGYRWDSKVPLSDARDYLAALRDEPYRLRNEPFSLIEQIPMPAEFAALWASDLERLAKEPTK